MTDYTGPTTPPEKAVVMDAPTPDPEVTARVLHDLYGEDVAQVERAKARSRQRKQLAWGLGSVMVGLAFSRMRVRAGRFRSESPRQDEQAAVRHLAESEVLLKLLNHRVSHLEDDARRGGVPRSVVFAAASYALWQVVKQRNVMPPLPPAQRTTAFAADAPMPEAAPS